MNNSIYDEYMRSVLGYQPMNFNNTYDTNYDDFSMSNTSYDMTAMSNIQRAELENCYPEIYKIVFPMVQKACMQNTRPITRELIDSMTEEIYFSIEDNELLESRSKDKTKTSEKATEDRQRIIRNQGLNDLIRILLLRELLGRPGFPGGRPPQFLPRPPRPPMRPPMGPPPRPQPRPGMNRQTFGGFENMYDLYEY